MKIRTTLLRCAIAAVSIAALAAPTPAQAAETIGPGWASLASLELTGYNESRLFPAGGGDLVAVIVKPNPVGQTTTAAVLYDRATDTWGAPIPAPQLHGQSFIATQLHDGRVLVLGGFEGGKNASLFDPQAQTWTPTTPMPRGSRQNPVTLTDGRVLAYGSDASGLWAATYEPVTATWTATQAPPQQPLVGEGVALADGRAAMLGYNLGNDRLLLWSPSDGSWSEAPLVPGHPESVYYRGIVATGTTVVAFVPGDELQSWRLETTNGTWTRMGDLRGYGQAYSTRPATATLPDGRVLAVGGNNGYSSEELRANRTAQILDPATGVWTPTGALAATHPDSALTVADGKAYILQDRFETKALEVLDPAGAPLVSEPTVAVTTTTSPDPEFNGRKLVRVDAFDAASFMAYLDVPLRIEVLPGGASPARAVSDCLYSTSCVTGWNGTATAILSNQTAAGVDTLRVHADFDGDGAVNGDEPVGTGTVTWERRGSYLAVDPPQQLLEMRFPLAVRARMTYVGGCDYSNSYGSGCYDVYRPVAGRLVTFYAADDATTPLCRARTGANGYAQCGFYVERVKAVAAGVRAVFSGDALYDASEAAAPGIR